MCVSIQLVSPASGEQDYETFPKKATWVGFHSISFPSEWGERKSRLRCRPQNPVSIQLVSPASGEGRKDFDLLQSVQKDLKFPFN